LIGGLLDPGRCCGSMLRSSTDSLTPCGILQGIATSPCHSVCAMNYFATHYGELSQRRPSSFRFGYMRGNNKSALAEAVCITSCRLLRLSSLVRYGGNIERHYRTRSEPCLNPRGCHLPRFPTLRNPFIPLFLCRLYPEIIQDRVELSAFLGTVSSRGG
jgi:hypothetical protein